MLDFITSCICHLENIGSLTYMDLPNVSTFHYTVLHNIVLISHQIHQDFVKFTAADTSSPQNIHLKARILLQTKNIFLEEKGLFFISEKMPAKYLSLNNCRLSVSCFK